MDFSTIVYAEAASEITQSRIYGTKTDGTVFDVVAPAESGVWIKTELTLQGRGTILSLTVESPVGQITDASGLFVSLHRCIDLDVSLCDLSNATSMANCFQSNYALPRLDVSELNISNKCADMQYAFSGMLALIELKGLHTIDSSGVTNFTSTFSSVNKMTNYGTMLPSTASATTVRAMFAANTELQTLDISDWDLSNVPACSQVYQFVNGNTNLLTVYCRSQEDIDKLFICSPQYWPPATIQFIVGNPPQQDLIFDPQEVNLGLLTTPTTYTLTIENGFAQTITADVIRQNYSGVLDSLGDTVTLQAGEVIEVLVDVSMSGSFNLNARLILDVPSIGRAFTHYITAQRGLVISYRPDQGLTEKWAWQTEILTDYNYNEDRLALRTVPRMTFNVPYTLKQGADATQMERILYEAYSIKSILPRFELQTSARVDNATKTIFCDTAYGGWQADMTGIAWKNSQEFEFFEVYEVTADFLTIKSEFTQDMTSCRVMPANAVNMINSPTRSDGQGMYSKFNVEFYAEAPPHWNIPDPAQEYEGVELCDMRLPVSSGGRMQRTYVIPRVVMDNGISVPMYAHTRPVATQSYQVTIPCNSLDDIMYWREFLLRRQGAIRPFWASSKRHDIKILEPVTSSQDSIIVEGGNTGLTPPDKSPRSMVMLQLNDGTIIYRKIRTFTAVDGKQEIRFTTSPGVNANPEDFKRVSFFSQFRLASDEVEWKWTKTWKATVTFAVQELYI